MKNSIIINTGKSNYLYDAGVWKCLREPRHVKKQEKIHQHPEKRSEVNKSGTQLF
ncbi:MAG: hypothetical protein R6T99_07005 [Bacteroidales bacterium]